MRAPPAAFALLLVTLLLVTLLLLTPASAQDAPSATLTIDVQEDHDETMTLRLDGLRRLTQYQGICLPEGARETRVYDDLGDVQHEARDEDGRRALSFTARSEHIMVDMARAGPDGGDAPIFSNDANFCVPSRASVEVVVRVPQAHTLFFMSDGGVAAGGREARSASDGPTHVFYSYEAPEGALEAFDVGPFRVLVPSPQREEAEEVARLAAAPYAASLAEAGLDAPFRPLRVLFAAQTPLAWEAGHYGGRGYVSMKLSTLSGESSEGYPYAGVKVLVHEGFHAASFPYGRGEVEDTIAWWLEGTARHAERQVDATMPNATRHCTKSAVEVRCWDFDDRIPRDALETGYSSSFAFDPDWEPSRPQTDETRRFYYGYSEFVVASWIARHGESAYREAWDEIEAALLHGEGCPCEDGWLEDVLGSDPMLFRPWADVRREEPERFETLVRPYVKDEEALQRELDARANPLSGIPLPPLVALGALASAALLLRRRG